MHFAPQYRRVPHSVYSEVLDKLEPGDYWHHAPFASTTFVERDAGFPHIMFVAKKGWRGYMFGPTSEHEHEDEVLMPRGMMFKVLGREGNRIILELVNEPERS